MLNISGLGNHKLQYKDPDTINFDSLNTYLLLARKSISRFANQFYNGLADTMLKDEDAISNIANAIMMADWRWDENYQNEKGTKKTRYSYRNQCAIWAIQTYVSKNAKRKKSKKNIHVSLDHIIGSEDGCTTIHNLTKDAKAHSPEDILVEKEQKAELSHLISSLLELECLSTRQKDYIRLYYFEEYTFEKIGKQYGVTREAVRQALNKAINIIQNSITG